MAVGAAPGLVTFFMEFCHGNCSFIAFKDEAHREEDKGQDICMGSKTN